MVTKNKRPTTHDPSAVGEGLRIEQLAWPYETNMAGSGQEFSEAVMPWCHTLERAQIPRVIQTFYQVYRHDQLVARVVTHTLHRLNLARYFPAFLKSPFLKLQAWGLPIFYLTILFVEIPLANRPGIVFMAEPSADEQSKIEAFVVSWLQANCPYDLLCVKTVHGRTIGNLAGVSFLDNMYLALPFLDFDEYAWSRSSNARYTIRRNKRIFQEAGCHFRWSDTIAPWAAEITALYHATCAYHAQKGEMESPIPVGQAFFTALDAIESLPKKVLTIWQQETLIGFALIVASDGQWYFKLCGLDYDRAPAARAYFNLYYELITEALAQGVHRVDLGANTYETKRRLGGLPKPTYYGLHFKKWLYKPLSYVLKLTVTTQQKQTQAPL